MTYVAASYGAQAAYPMPPYGGYPGYGYAQAPGYAYGADAYQGGYASGGQWASPYATQMGAAGDGLSGVANSLFGLVNGVVGGVSDLLGGLVNGVTGMAGGTPSYGYAQAYPQAYNGYYGQPYGNYYPQPAYAPQQGYYPQQGYGQQAPFTPPPPGRNFAARYQAIAGDIQRAGYLYPQQGVQMIATAANRAEENRRRSDEYARDARSTMRRALSLAERAARSGNAQQMSEAVAMQQRAMDSIYRSGEFALAVWDQLSAAQITYNLLFGPSGRMRGADRGASIQFLQKAQMQWEGGRDRSRWFSPTIQPPYQEYLQVNQEVAQMMERMAQLRRGIR